MLKFIYKVIRAHLKGEDYDETLELRFTIVDAIFMVLLIGLIVWII
jgi:hypothetical protein